MKKFFKPDQYYPFIIAGLSFLALCFFIYEFNDLSNNRKEEEARDKLLEILISKKSQIEKALYSRIYYTKGIAAYCSINPEITNEQFYKLAKELIKNDTVISSMALSKDCILNAIYPLKGHESAIGLNLLEHPFRRKIVESTIRTRNTFVAGPVELVEGGIAFISYTPIFTHIGNDSSYFWGVTDIVIYKDKLFAEINLEAKDDKYKFALKGNDGTGADGKCFWGFEDIYNTNPVTVDIILPTGKWIFAAEPIKGWEKYSDYNRQLTLILYFCALIISILILQLVKTIIKLKNNEQYLKESKSNLEELNAAKDKFLSIIAHDLRGPFSGFIGISQELKENLDYLQPVEIRELADLLHSSATNTFLLLNNLLDWSRIHMDKMEINPQKINIHSEVENIKTLFIASINSKNINVINSVRQNLYILADLDMFSTILRNIISNALKFTNEDGEVIISAESKDKFIEISISDSGIGIKKELIDIIFNTESGVSTMGTAGESGTGLGLQICKELVEKNGGQIRVSSTPGKGTIFYFTFPAGN